MNITVFGANGKVGSLVVTNALGMGYNVTAFVHGNSRLADHQNLNIVQGDIYDSQSVTNAIKNADVIISALGSWHTPQKDVLAKGMQNIVTAMQTHNIKRVISLTGADARWRQDKLSLIHRFTYIFVNLLAGKILHDGEKHIELLNHSGLDWTVLRSPVMNEQGQDLYSLTTRRPLPWQTIHRHAVAKALVDLCESKDHNKSSPYIVRN